jgi:hypothetical protein
LIKQEKRLEMKAKPAALDFGPLMMVGWWTESRSSWMASSTWKRRWPEAGGGVGKAAAAGSCPAGCETAGVAPWS